MTLMDFVIGAALMNAMPHFVLGIWKGRMFSAFGIGNKQNIFYGLLNFIISLGLFVYQYGVEKLLNNGMYVGASAILIIYFLTGHFWYHLFKKDSH